MSNGLSRRTVLTTAGTVATASVAGCLEFGENEQIDVTVGNATDTELDYEVSIESFEEAGTVDGGRNDQYEDVLDQPDSSGQFEVVARFGIALSGEKQNSTADNETTNTENGSAGEAFLEAGSLDDTVDVNSNVVELSISFSEQRIVVNPVVKGE